MHLVAMVGVPTLVAWRGARPSGPGRPWQQTGLPSCLNADVPNDMFVGIAIHTDTSARAFGTMTVKYLTTGFAARAV
jgi:hypothetical protein